jgi:hypothetical protein
MGINQIPVVERQHDGSGNPIGSIVSPDGSTYALDIHNSHVHTKVINKHALLDVANTDTFDQNASAGDSTIEVNNSSQFTANDYIRINEGTTHESDILKVIASDGTDPGTLTLDRPLENGYTADTGVITEIQKNAASAAGTIAAPIIYQITPMSDQVFHIESIIIHIEDGTQPTIDTFGGIAALTNGLVIRSETSSPLNHSVIRSNGAMKEYFGGENVEFIQKSGGGDWATNAIWLLYDHSNAIIRLDGSNSDTLDFIVQDDVTANTEIEIICQGHIEG